MNTALAIAVTLLVGIVAMAMACCDDSEDWF